MFHVVIPARYASERLPGKPLTRLAGKPMVQHVYDRALESGADSVTVATDDERIVSACRDFGATALLTAATHQSGTDRIAEVATQQGWSDDQVVINLQGDEPLMPPALIADVAATLIKTNAEMATLAAPITEQSEFDDPNAVKVVCNEQGDALYFSRAPIPVNRGRGVGEEDTLGLRHIGLYAYRVETLRVLTQAPPCTLECLERLEQLRALWMGMRIAVSLVLAAPPAGVDTAADVARVEAFLNQANAD